MSDLQDFFKLIAEAKKAKPVKKEEKLTFTQNTLSKIIYQMYVWKHTYNESFFLISSIPSPIYPYFPLV